MHNLPSTDYSVVPITSEIRLYAMVLREIKRDCSGITVQMLINFPSSGGNYNFFNFCAHHWCGHGGCLCSV